MSRATAATVGYFLWRMFVWTFAAFCDNLVSTERNQRAEPSFSRSFEFGDNFSSWPDHVSTHMLTRFVWQRKSLKKHRFFFQQTLKEEIETFVGLCHAGWLRQEKKRREAEKEKTLKGQGGNSLE